MASYLQDFPFGILDVVELLHLNRRRPGPNSIYTDCPFCGDRRGKMNINYVKNVWRCNYCGEYGGMLDLYARVNHTTCSDAYREICDSIGAGDIPEGYAAGTGPGKGEPIPGSLPGNHTVLPEEIPQSPRASIQEIHQTLSMLFGMLTLSTAHRDHLRSPKRGLNDSQIDRLGFKSTPPPFLCRSMTERLIKQDCTVQGVPGFYLDQDNRWTVKFHKRTSGILIPAIGVDGLIRGAQILLDIPIKNKDDPPGKAGTKYIWFSSSTKNMGITSGSPVHFVGNPFARTIYVTEGLLKADISHCLMNRSFAAVAGANNVQQLDLLFALLARNGTELIVEAHDTDKFSNQMTSKGASKIYLLAKKHGMDCRPLTWNPNYKGIDDWQLALREKENQKRKEERMVFKEKYLSGLCEIGLVEECVKDWHTRAGNGVSLEGHLGLTNREYEIYIREGCEGLKVLLDAQRRVQCYRIYQLDFGEERKTIPFAYKGIGVLHEKGYEQPPAAEYRLVCDGRLACRKDMEEIGILNRIFSMYNEKLPEGYKGRSLSPSDVVELYGDNGRSYFYVDPPQFVPVRFSPFLAKPMKETV